MLTIVKSEIMYLSL